MKGCWKLTAVAVLCLYWVPIWGFAAEKQLRFGKNGEFKILQVADMHFADGKMTPCEDVLPSQVASCSDLNTTAFVRRMILAEKPHLIVFTGDFVFSLCCFLLTSDIELRLHTINYC
jgi:predicted MPP superfamily phosphohydrolase